MAWQSIETPGHRPPGAPVPGVHLDVPTLDIPADCACSWVVIRPGPGYNAVSRLKYANALCPHRHTAAGGGW